MKRSTGLRNAMLSGGSFKSVFDGSVIKVYAGSVAPNSADDALPSDAVLLLTYSLNGSGSGVTLESTAAAGTIAKNSSEVWQGTIVTSGTPLFFRVQLPNDSNAASTDANRLQGSVGLTDADLIVSAMTFSAGDERRLNYFLASIAAG